MSEELKPVNCGCGGKAEVRGFENLDDSVSIYVCCSKCHTSTVSFTGDQAEENAVETWNTAINGLLPEGDPQKNVGVAITNSAEPERTAKVEQQGICWEDIRHYREGMCGVCGRTVYDDAKYCDECGARLEWK